MNLTMPNPKTAALDFEEFSYVDGQGTFRRIDAAWLDILSEYLAEYYQAESVSERLPYLVVWCNDTMPPPSERPFMIAGLVAVWLVQGKDKYPQVRFSSYRPMYTRKPHTKFARRLCWHLRSEKLARLAWTMARTHSLTRILLRNDSAIGLMVSFSSWIRQFS